MAKLTKKLQVELGAISLNAKGSSSIKAKFGIDDSGMDANEICALLVGSVLNCRLDKGNPKQAALPLTGGGAEVSAITTMQFKGSCKSVSIDSKKASMGIAWTEHIDATTLEAFAGQSAKLTVTRVGDLNTTEEPEKEEAGETDKGDTE